MADPLAVIDQVLATSALTADDRKLLNKIKECCGTDNYFNLDTKRTNKSSTITKNKIPYKNDLFHFVASDQLQFTRVSQLLSCNLSDNDQREQLEETTSSIIGPSETIELSSTNKRNKANKVSKNNKPRQSSRLKRKRAPIPQKLRLRVWRNQFSNSRGQCLMNGICYCCDCEIALEEWHCGHIISDHHGGVTEAHNLRPTCVNCNLAMGTMNMFEYIINNDLPGIRHLKKESKTVVSRALDFAEVVVLTETRLNKLLKHGHITKKSFNKYMKKVKSKRGTMDDRLKIMEEIRTLYKSYIMG